MFPGTIKDRVRNIYFLRWLIIYLIIYYYYFILFLAIYFLVNFIYLFISPFLVSLLRDHPRRQQLCGGQGQERGRDRTGLGLPADDQRQDEGARHSLEGRRDILLRAVLAAVPQ